MRAQLTKEFRFEAAHTLPSLPEDHKCRQMHGHSFKIDISVEGEVNEEIGWVYDHKRISDAMNPLLELLDHGYLNDMSPVSRVPLSRGWQVGFGKNWSLIYRGFVRSSFMRLRRRAACFGGSFKGKADPRERPDRR